MDLAEKMIQEFNLVEINIDNNLIAAAELKAKDLPINKKSYMDGTRHLIGALGEVIFQKYVGNFMLPTSFDSDIIIDGLAFDVKSKQRTWCDRKKLLTFGGHGYEGSVQAVSTDEILEKNVDGYVFISISKALDKAYIVGWINKHKFVELARKIEPNMLDRSNNQVSPANNYNIFYKDLEPIKCLNTLN